MPYSLVGGYTLPVRTALIETTDNTGTVDIVATGLLNGNAVVHEEAIVGFLEGQVMLLKLFLDVECVVDPCAADPTKTCTANEHSELFSRPPTASAMRAPFAAVPIVVILVPLPAAGGPLVAAARMQVAPVRPDVTVVPPAVVAAVPDVAPTLHHALFARGRRLVAPGVNDQHCCLRRWSRQRRNSQARKRQPCQSQFPIRHGVLSLPLLKERQNLLARPSTSAQSSSATTSTYSTFRANNAIAVSSSACGRLPFPRAAHSIKMEARLIQFE
jgi:hypothetical protein